MEKALANKTGNRAGKITSEVYIKLIDDDGRY